MALNYISWIMFRNIYNTSKFVSVVLQECTHTHFNANHILAH